MMTLCRVALVAFLWASVASGGRVIIVLGCTMSLLEGRVHSAADEAGPDDVVVFTGGMGEAALAEWLFLNRYDGNPRTQRVLEDASHTTRENAEFTAHVLQERGEDTKSIVLVTDWFHRARAMALFKTVFPRSRFVFVGTRTWQVLPLKHIIWSLRECMALVKALAKGHVTPRALFAEIVGTAAWLFERMRLRFGV
jgi:uncharacterized SAM-binding protein YcdF (DUF218 family)